MLSEELLESLSVWLMWLVRNEITESDPALGGGLELGGTRFSFQLDSGAMCGDNVDIISYGLKMN